MRIRYIFIIYDNFVREFVLLFSSIVFDRTYMLPNRFSVPMSDQLLSLRNVFVWRFVSVFLLSFCIAYILPSFVFFYYKSLVLYDLILNIWKTSPVWCLIVIDI